MRRALALGAPVTMAFVAPRAAMGLPPAARGALDAIQQRQRGESAAWARRRVPGIRVMHRSGNVAAVARAIASELDAEMVVIDASIPHAAREAAQLAEVERLDVLLARPSARHGLLAATGASEAAHVVVSHAAALAKRIAAPLVTVHDASRPKSVGAIVQLAERLTPDVLVLGTHRRSRLSRWLFRSVEELAAERCTSSVLFTPSDSNAR